MYKYNLDKLLSIFMVNVFKFVGIDGVPTTCSNTQGIDSYISV